ncbi:MAG: DNA repair protein RecN [Phycisphaerales bacterium]|nr:DNA repair protein RecN [Phycisphaerales bacterium]
MHIENLAVIAEAQVEFTPGLNVFTGETGAGKSLLIGAFEVLLAMRHGGKASANLIRTGCDEARISGLFEIRNPATARDIAQILDRDVDPAEGLLITRRLFATGRSSISINSSPATVGMLEQIAERLVDIHGQHDQQYLLRPANQLRILDDYAGCSEARGKFAEHLSALRALESLRDELTAADSLRRQQQELYEFQRDEIATIDPRTGEFNPTRATFDRLSNITTLQASANEISRGLCEVEPAALDMLQTTAKALDDLAKLDPEALSPLSESAQGAVETVRELAFDLNRYASNLDLDGEQFEATQQRLDELNHLIHKYGGGKYTPLPEADDPIDEVVAYREHLDVELAKLTGDSERLEQIDAEIATATATLLESGEALRAQRTAAGKRLKPLIETQLSELGMGEAKFSVQLAPLSEGEFKTTGLDEVEFLVQTNPGQDAQPLRLIASGGELSRIMLAIKSILAGSDRVSVLVFDEIDSNIGGRLGTTIGRKMRDLAAGNSAHQVLCITHLPQIAAFGDTHLHIAKTVTGDGDERNTSTSVKPLYGEDRLRELAEMIAGKDLTPGSIAQGRELLELAAK